MSRFLLHTTSSAFANRLLQTLRNEEIVGEFVRSFSRMRARSLQKDIAVWIFFTPTLDDTLFEQLEFGTNIKRVVILDACSTETRLRLWQLGVDDVIEYPCTQSELAIRIKKQFKPVEQVIELSTTKFFPERGELVSNDETITVSQLERRLLLCLAHAKNVFCSREILMDRVWPVGVFASDDALDVLIRRLRIKLRQCKLMIISRRGYGYKLEQSGTETVL